MESVGQFHRFELGCWRHPQSKVVDQLVESEAFNLCGPRAARVAITVGKATGSCGCWRGQRVDSRSDTVLAERSPQYACRWPTDVASWRLV